MKSVIKTAVLSFIFIFLVHNLYLFFKTNLTVPKVKDLVITSDEKYSDIYEVINTQTNEDTEPTTQFEEPENNTLNMKDQLKNYIKNISINNLEPKDTTDINSI
jgi:hypothetical protein